MNVTWACLRCHPRFHTCGREPILQFQWIFSLLSVTKINIKPYQKKKDKHKAFKARVMRIEAVPTSTYLCEMDIISRFDQDIFDVLRARSTMKSYCIGCLHAKEREATYDITGKSKSCSEDLGPGQLWTILLLLLFFFKKKKQITMAEKIWASLIMS